MSVRKKLRKINKRASTLIWLSWEVISKRIFYDAIRKCCKNCAYFLLNIVVFSPSNLCTKRLALKVHGLKKVFWPFLLHLAHAPELGQCLVWQKRESAFFCCIFFEGHEREKKGSSTWQKRALLFYNKTEQIQTSQLRAIQWTQHSQHCVIVLGLNQKNEKKKKYY